MSKVEKYIQDHTRNCSNVLISVQSRTGEEVISYNPWLTPDHARVVAEIAKEEVLEKVWHDADTEQPKEGETVIVWSAKDSCGEVLTNCMSVNKGRIWCYLSDILPNKEESV